VRTPGPRIWAICTVLLVCGVIAFADSLSPCAFAQQSPPSNDQSWSSSISSGVKRGFGKIGNALNPKPSPTSAAEDDAVSLKNEANPSPKLYVAVARLYQQAERLGDAEAQYLLALKAKRDFLPALLGYAELKEKMGEAGAAVQLYQKAASLYPQEASVYNNMGWCYARQGRLSDAETAMARAVQLAPKNARYRNNMATVLVDQGKIAAADSQLRQVYDEAPAYYNLGYMLNKKGQTRAAMQHFAMAVQTDPSMAAAQRWLDYLERTTMQAKLPNHPMANGLRISPDSKWANARDDSTPGNLAAGDSPSPRVGKNKTTPSQAAERPRLVEPDSGPSVALPAAPAFRDERAEGLPPTSTDQPAAPPAPSHGAKEPSLPEAPMPAEPPRRLPPVAPRNSDADGPSLPGISYNDMTRPAAPSAPLPPPENNTAVRRLPPVR
jgi:Tfp pilus assembly protein PilF